MRKKKIVLVLGLVLLILISGVILVDRYSWKIAVWREISKLQTNVKKDPQNVEILLQLGRLYSNINKPKKAMKAFETILKIDQNNAEALARLGDVESRMVGQAKSIEAKMKLSREALMHLDGAVEKFPDQYIAYLVRGINGVYWPDMFQRYKTSIGDLVQVIEMKEKDPNIFKDEVLAEVYYYLGVAHEKNKEFDEAKVCWEKVTNQYPYSTYYTKLSQGRLKSLKK